jgi:hypothetical protein
MRVFYEFLSSIFHSSANSVDDKLNVTSIGRYTDASPIRRESPVAD